MNNKSAIEILSELSPDDASDLIQPPNFQRQKSQIGNNMMSRNQFRKNIVLPLWSGERAEFEFHIGRLEKIIKSELASFL